MATHCLVATHLTLVGGLFENCYSQLDIITEIKLIPFFIFFSTKSFMASFSYLNMFKVWLFKSIKPWCYPVAINICNKSSMYVYVCYFFSFHFAITNLKLSGFASLTIHVISNRYFSVLERFVWKLFWSDSIPYPRSLVCSQFNLF